MTMRNFWLEIQNLLDHCLCAFYVIIGETFYSEYFFYFLFLSCDFGEQRDLRILFLLSQMLDLRDPNQNHY